MMQTITILDSQILLWIQQNLHTNGATAFWEFMTDLGNKGFLWILIILGLLIRKRSRFVGLTASLAFVMNTLVCNGILKHLVARPRPFSMFTDIVPLIMPPTDFSFPSGHTSISFAIAFVLYALLPRRWGIPAVVTAFLIGLSRLYLEFHYPSDVLAGAIIGFAVAKLAVGFMKKRKPVAIPAALQGSTELH